jgi:hypothetical protein
MAELRRWAFAAFHTALLVVAGVWAVHLAGSVGDLLQGLNTAVGLGVYGLLWAITWAATGRAFAAAPPVSASRRRQVGYGALYGAAIGIGFLLSVVLGGGGLLVVVGRFDALALVLVAAVGSVAATVIGAVIGACFGAIDGVLARIGETLAAPAD